MCTKNKKKFKQEMESAWIVTWCLKTKQQREVGEKPTE